MFGNNLVIGHFNFIFLIFPSNLFFIQLDFLIILNVNSHFQILLIAENVVIGNTLIRCQLVIAVRVLSNKVIHLLNFSKARFIVRRLLNILQGCNLQGHRKINSFAVRFGIQIVLLGLNNLGSVWSSFLFGHFAVLVAVNILSILRRKVVPEVEFLVFYYLGAVEIGNLNLILKQTSIYEGLWPDRLLIWADSIEVLIIRSCQVLVVFDLLGKNIGGRFNLTVLNN